MMTAENKKKAAKYGAKGGKLAAKFGFGKLKENVDLGEFEDLADSECFLNISPIDLFPFPTSYQLAQHNFIQCYMWHSQYIT